MRAAQQLMAVFGAQSSVVSSVQDDLCALAEHLGPDEYR